MNMFNKISIGDHHEDEWLSDAIEEYIEKNPLVDDLTLMKDFKMRIDILADILTTLRIEGKIERIFSGDGNFKYKKIWVSANMI